MYPPTHERSENDKDHYLKKSKLNKEKLKEKIEEISLKIKHLMKFGKV